MTKQFEMQNNKQRYRSTAELDQSAEHTYRLAVMNARERVLQDQLINTLLTRCEKLKAEVTRLSTIVALYGY